METLCVHIYNYEINIHVLCVRHSYKQLANRGYKDGMVGYGNCLNNGIGNKSKGNNDEDEVYNEVEAAKWWKQACGGSSSSNRHSQGCYEYAVALYTGK